MIRIGAENKRRKLGPDAVRGRLRLQPTVLSLESRELLSQLTVSNINDSGPGSLRAAVVQANSDGGGDTITFSSLFNEPQTIALTSGELQLTGGATTTITGPGANLLTISGGGQSRVLYVDFSSAALSGLTISGGSVASSDFGGGGVLSVGSTLTLTNVTVSRNSTGGNGAGVACSGTGSATTLINCTVSGNTGSGFGSGLYNGTYDTMTLIGCTVGNNSGAYKGGGLLNSGTLSMTNCTINANSTGNPTSGLGGGLLNTGTVSMINCTVSGNTADVFGGGLVNGGTLSMTNCTVSGNSTKYGEAGLVNSGTLTMTNTIVAGNSFGDVHGALQPGSANNLIGDGSDLTGISNGSQENQVGTAQAPLDPVLAPLGDYGGPTFTMALLPSSPAIGAATSSAGVPITDQRGQPRAGRVDIGAFESQGFRLTPAALSSPQSAAIGKTFAHPLAVMVTAVNPIEPVDGGVIAFAVTPVNGASATLSAATAVISSGQATLTATANTTPGTFLVSASVDLALPAGLILTNTETLSLTRMPTPVQTTGPGSGVVTWAPTSVQSTGAGTRVVTGLIGLRNAIAYANGHPGPDIIIFDPPSEGAKHRTRRLTGGALVFTDPATTTIIGPGAGMLSLSGGGKGRVFDIQGGSLALHGVTITGGRAVRGGGIRNDGGTLWLDHVVVRGNRAKKGGALFNDGTATLSHVVLRGNAARVASRVFNARNASLTRRGVSGPNSASQVLVDYFDGNGGVPKNWRQIFGGAGDVKEQPYHLTITDSTGASAGIASTLPSSVFNPVGVVTTIRAQIYSVGAGGNAIFGLIGQPAKGALPGFLAAGIDSEGNLFIVEQDASIPQKIVPIGITKGYTGGPIALNFVIDSTGVEVSGPGFDCGKVYFDEKLDNFSLASGFSNGAIAALVAASQPDETGGSATFGPIHVVTVAA
jgi:hypothetical protein